MRQQPKLLGAFQLWENEWAEAEKARATAAAAVAEEQKVAALLARKMFEPHHTGCAWGRHINTKSLYCKLNIAPVLGEIICPC